MRSSHIMRTWSCSVLGFRTALHSKLSDVLVISMIAVGCGYPVLSGVGEADAAGDGYIATPSICADGHVTGEEQCDDGNAVAGDGCSATCTLEAGFACVSTGGASVCHVTKCGDGVVEGYEECDDGDVVPFDGCSSRCMLEPHCDSGECAPVCGDGLKDPTEACDDGNLLAFDGCSAACAVETGWHCDDVTAPPSTSLSLPILYRDMLYRSTTTPAAGHPDFEAATGSQRGLVASHLATDGKPVKSTVGTAVLTSALAFCWWYHESGCGTGSVNPFDKLVYLDTNGGPMALQLTQQANPLNYEYSSAAFFPIDELGWNAGPSVQITDGHNFSFTSESHFPFTYRQGAAELSFTGDDDVWVFVGGQLAVDLGGVHAPQSAVVPIDSSLGLQEGHNYSVDLFQAERHTPQSDYKLGLKNFTQTSSACIRK